MSGYYDFRSPNGYDYGQLPVLRYLKNINKSSWKIVEFESITSFPDAAAEIMVDFTAVFDGSGTAAKVFHDSVSADDAAAGTGVQQLELFGINDSNDYATETLTMAGTTGTTGTTDWTRLIDSKATRWGSGGKAANTITIQDDAAGTNKHITIAQNFNSAVSHRLYVEEGWAARPMDLYAENQMVSHATDDVLLDHAGLISYLFVENSVDGEYLPPSEVMTVLQGTPYYNNKINTEIIGGDDAYVSIKVENKQDDVDQVVYVKQRYLVYEV